MTAPSNDSGHPAGTNPDAPSPDADPSASITPASPDAQARRASGSKFLGVLDTIEHITDKEERTTQALRFMPWAAAFSVILLAAVLLGVDMVTAHAHAGDIAKSAVVRWSFGTIVCSTGAAAAVAKSRRAAKKRAAKAASPDSGGSRSACPRQARQGPYRRCVHPVGTPSGGTRHGK